jgi:hypothetical protein
VFLLVDDVFFVSDVHLVTILIEVFCVVCSLMMLEFDAIGDRINTVTV